MRIGIIGDTHSDEQSFLNVINKLNFLKVDLVIHTGDWSSVSMLSHCENLKCEVYSVFGNCDVYYIDSMNESPFVKFFSPILSIEKDGIMIGAYHGHDERYLKELLNSNKFDVFFSGNTHIARLEKIGKTLHVNPGSVSQPRAGGKSYAVFDTATKKAEIYSL